MSGHTAIVIALGGNLGGTAAVLERFAAVTESISDWWGAPKMSSYYITAPVGPVHEQPDFVNAAGAWWPKSLPTPEAALALLQDLELRHGRERVTVGGARTLDLDLLLHAGEERGRPGLRVPHPRMGQRAFVLRPLQDLFGDDFCWDPGMPNVGTLLAQPDVATQACTRLAD